MSRRYFEEEMKNGEEVVATDGVQFQKELKRELKSAERTKCDEKHDIRDDSLKQGDCFTPSGRKVMESIIRSSEKPKVSTDPNLHSDTTEPGDNTITSNPYEKSYAPSGEKVLSGLQDKKVPQAVKREVFNS